MNELIKKLWKQSKTSGVHPELGEYDKYSVEKFAELIVRECAAIALREDHEPSECILKHFGVDK